MIPKWRLLTIVSILFNIVITKKINCLRLSGKSMEDEIEEGKFEEGVNLLDYLIILAKRKIFIVILTLSVTLFTAAYSLTFPELFKAETTLLPPGQSNQTSVVMQEIGSLMGLEKGSGGISDTGSILGMIRSRTIYDRIIDRFNLMDMYQTKYRGDARKTLAGNIEVNNDKTSHLITIAVINEDPKLASNMANAIVDEMKNLLQTIAITEASQKRLFFEEELQQARENLVKSEDAMVEFQEKTGALRVEDQTRAVIESMAHIRAQIAAKEVELKVMKTYSTLNNPDFQMSMEALKGLKDELKKLEEKSEISTDTLLTTGMLPGLGTDYIRKLRDLRFNETLFELMAKQYEMARIDEARDPSILQILDKAIPPEKRFKPERKKMVIIAFITTLFFSIFSVFCLEYIEKQKNLTGKDKEKAQIIWDYLSFKRKV